MKISEENLGKSYSSLADARGPETPPMESGSSGSFLRCGVDSSGDTEFWAPPPVPLGAYNHTII